MRIAVLLSLCLLGLLFLTACGANKEELAIDIVKNYDTGNSTVNEAVNNMYHDMGGNTLMVLEWDASCLGKSCKVTQRFKGMAPIPASVWDVDLETKEIKAISEFAQAFCANRC